jgi:hypothetical protein
MLSEAGYKTVGVSANPWISDEFGYSTGFDEFYSPKQTIPFDDSQHPREFSADEKNGPISKYASFVRWLASGNPVKRAINMYSFRKQTGEFPDATVLNELIDEWLGANSGDPFFLFANYMDAHEPYTPDQERLKKFRDGGCTVDVTWHLPSLDETYSEQEIACIGDRYDASLNFLDQQMGMLVEILERNGVFEDTLIVLTSDHGKCLGEHDYMGVGTFLYNELVQVPLLVSTADDNPISITDPMDHIRVHDMIRSVAGLDSVAERLPGVFAETAGPHQDVELDNQLPVLGQRRIDAEGATIVRDKQTGEIRQSSGDKDETLTSLESNYLNTLIESEIGTTEPMSENVRKQLEDLGYIN